MCWLPLLHFFLLFPEGLGGVNSPITVDLALRSFWLRASAKLEVAALTMVVVQDSSMGDNKMPRSATEPHHTNCNNQK